MAIVFFVLKDTPGQFTLLLSVLTGILHSPGVMIKPCECGILKNELALKVLEGHPLRA